MLSPELLAEVKAYKMPPGAEQLLKEHPPLIIAGIAASGKNTILNYLIEHGQWRRVITHVTRQPRQGELDGRDYWFVSPNQMLELLKQKAFIEAKVIHEDKVYGTSLKAYSAAVSQADQPIILLDVQGVLEFATHIPGLKAVFVLPPSFDAWQARLAKRGQSTPAEDARRARSAIAELQAVLDHPELFTLLINDEVPRVAKEIIASRTDPVVQAKNRQIAAKLLADIKRG